MVKVDTIEGTVDDVLWYHYDLLGPGFDGLLQFANRIREFAPPEPFPPVHDGQRPD